LTEVASVSAGEEFSLALLENGTVMAWGKDFRGQLGNGATGLSGSSDVPVPVVGLSEVVAVSAGAGFSLALLKNGTVVAWGSNEAGQLGDGAEGPGTESDVPVAVTGLSEVVAIAAGTSFGLAVRRNGTVMAWGQNAHGQLGDGAEGFASSSDVPVPVS